MRLIFLAWFIFEITFSHAQIIENASGTAFTEENFFNTEFIRNNKIRIIQGKIASKREGEAVQERDQFYHYEFDRNGRLSVMMSTFSLSSYSRDTTIIRYEYDSKGNLITKRRNDLYGFYAYYYEYDSLGRVTKETYAREENAGPDRYNFILGKQFIISYETFSYHKFSPKQLVKKYYNNYGRQYQEKFYYYNDLGYLTEEITRLTLSGKESKTSYAYNENGQLSQKSEISYIFGYNAKSNNYKYDQVGNLLEEEIFHNDKQVLLRSLLYEPTLLLQAQVTKDQETGIIYIIKYSYLFY